MMRRAIVLLSLLVFSVGWLQAFDFKKDQRLRTSDFRLYGAVKLVYTNTFQLAQKNSDELDLPVYSLASIQNDLNDLPDPDPWFMNYGKTSLRFLKFNEKGFLLEQTQVFAGMALDRTVYAYDDSNDLTWRTDYSMGEMTTFATYKSNRIVEMFDYNGKDEKQTIQPISKTFEYDSWSNKLKKVITKDIRNNEPLITYEMQFQGDSIVVRQESADSAASKMRTTIKIDSKGRLLEQESHEDGKLTELELRSYDKKGLDIMRSSYNNYANYIAEVSYAAQEILEKRIRIGEETPFETYKLVLSRPDEYGNWTLATLYHNQEQLYVILRTIRYYEK